MFIFNKILPRGLPELDSFRLLAVTLVLGHHMFADSDPIFHWLSLHGYVGVGLFFTLSGFIITLNLKREWQRHETVGLKSFWLRRAIRLWPSWLIALLLSCLVVYHFGVSNESIMTDLKTKWWHYFLHFGNYSHAWIGKLHTVFGHFWSLAIEEHFYFIWPLLFILLNRKKRWRPIVLGLMIILPYLFRVYYAGLGYDNAVNTLSTHTRIDSIAYGCIMALYFEKLPPLTSIKKELVLWAIGIILLQIGLSLKFYQGSVWLSQSAHSIRSLAALLFIYLLTKTPETGIRRLWRSNILSRLGVLSYGVYLFHNLGNVVLFKTQAALNLTISHWWLFIFSNLLAYLPAYLCYIFIDLSLERWKKRFK